MTAPRHRTAGATPQSRRRASALPSRDLADDAHDIERTSVTSSERIAGIDRRCRRQRGAVHRGRDAVPAVSRAAESNHAGRPVAGDAEATRVSVLMIFGSVAMDASASSSAASGYASGVVASASSMARPESTCARPPRRMHGGVAIATGNPSIVTGTERLGVGRASR